MTRPEVADCRICRVIGASRRIVFSRDESFPAEVGELRRVWKHDSAGNEFGLDQCPLRGTGYFFSVRVAWTGSGEWDDHCVTRLDPTALRLIQPLLTGETEIPSAELVEAREFVVTGLTTGNFTVYPGIHSVLNALLLFISRKNNNPYAAPVKEGLFAGLYFPVIPEICEANYPESRGSNVGNHWIPAFAGMTP